MVLLTVISNYTYFISIIYRRVFAESNIKQRPIIKWVIALVIITIQWTMYFYVQFYGHVIKIIS